MKKKILALLLLAGIAASTTVGVIPAAAEEDGEVTTIEIWGWETYDGMSKMYDRFKEVYPNIDLNFTNVSATDMPVRVQTALAAGTQLPDIVWAEMGVRGTLFALDCWEVLSEEPYNLDLSLIPESMIPLGSNEEGFVGIDANPAMAGLAYKRDLAKTYFGTDDPDELSAMFEDWDSLIEAGKKVREESGGEVYLFPGLGDVLTILKGQGNIPHVVDDVLQVDQSMGDAFDTLVAFKEFGLCDTITSGSPEWNASISEEKHIFIPCADWSPTWQIDLNDEENKVIWGLMTPPGGGFTYGGTCYCIPKTALHKEAAWTFLNWIYFTEESAILRRDAYGYFVPQSKLLFDPEFYSAKNPHFNDQDIVNYFTAVIAPNAGISRAISKYDAEINSALSLAVTALTASEEPMTKEELVKIVEDDVLANCPDLSLDH